MNLKHLATLALSSLCCIGSVHAQQVDIATLKDVFKARPVLLSGSVSANSIYYAGNGGQSREPFNYYLQGSLNANLFGKINLPFSFSFTNTGQNYSYPVPPDRLSLHPVYKWATAHIGDVAMSFSPYTLSGIQFRGVGVDLTPGSRWKCSAMYGRLQRAVDYDSTNENILPAYKRMGYGAKVSYEKAWYMAGINFFYAKDDANSLHLKPDSIFLLPQQNLALSYNLRLRPAKGLELMAEYANTAITEVNKDTAAKAPHNNYLQRIMHANSATNFYSALKVNMNYTYKQSTLGIGYEHIDPGYKTLGAYYFNNDFENITANFSQSLLKNKATIAVNIGLQRDNLDNAKAGTTKRTVGSINMNYAPNNKLQLSGSYSNFSTFMNMKSQFDYINQYLPFQNFDTLNYVQLSQNANLNVNWKTKQSSTQNQSLNINVNFQDASDQQGGIVRKGNSSQFYNLATTYTMFFVPQNLSITSGYNLSYNAIARNNMITQGPTINMGTKLLQKKLTTGITISYNQGRQNGELQGSVFNARLNAAYTLLRKHNISFSIIDQGRTKPGISSTNDMTATLGYNYSF